VSRISQLNFLIGFAVVFLAAAAGAFVAFDTTEAFINDPGELNSSWRMLLQRSSHGHVNLFGVLHICMGLTIPYSALKPKIKLLQTVGLALGTFAMGPLMLIRSFGAPSDKLDVMEALIGACLSCALLALGVHLAGILARYLQRDG
jgi:hypothetical protein